MPCARAVAHASCAPPRAGGGDQFPEDTPSAEAEGVDEYIRRGQARRNGCGALFGRAHGGAPWRAMEEKCGLRTLAPI